MTCILVTAFEPFGGGTVNPTQAIVSSLPKRINNAEVHTLSLPVSFAKTFEVLEPVLKATHFDAIVHLGLNASINKVALEMVAHNLIHSKTPDNDGNKIENTPINLNAPLAYPTRVDVWGLFATLQAKGLPIMLSSSAGNYLCNYTYFKTMHHVQSQKLTTPVLFVHVPATENMGLSPCLSLETEVDVVKAVLEFIVQNL